MALQYKDLSLSENVIGQEVIEWLLGDDEVMELVVGFHDRGTRCAVVVWLEHGEVVNAYISDETAVRDQFDLPRVKEALTAYDPTRSFCVIVVREDKDTAVLVGDID
jgi:hypothetical protein